MNSSDVDRVLHTRTDVGTLPPVHAVYQPIVDLDTNDVIAYEALARGPLDSPWASPAALFAEARAQKVEGALDLECRAAAMSGALFAGLPASIPLFINAEPRWLDLAWPPHLVGVLDQALGRLQVVVEITERALVEDPAGLLRAVREIRERGWGVALDDVGADPASLALMPFIDPDIIKLDLRLIQHQDDGDVAMIVNAVSVQAERSGAIVLAEGIETEEHRSRAQAMGATLGQGWLLGPPGPLTTTGFVTARHDLSFTRPQGESAATPFEAIRAGCPTRTITKALALPMSHHLEGHALRTSEPPVLLASFEHVRHFTAGTAARYARLSERCAFVGALGAGMSAVPVSGVRGADLALADRLAGEWVVCVVGPHFAGALIAKDLGDAGPDRERRFVMTLTHDRDVVLDVARTLFDRIARI